MRKFLYLLTILLLSPLLSRAQISTPALVGYWHNWTDNNVPYIHLDAIDTRYSVIEVAFAMPTSPSDMTMLFTPEVVSQSTFIAKMRTLQSQGKKVVISVGGATASIDLATTTAKNAFVNSMTSILTTYGFDGMDIDIEHGNSILISGGTIASPTNTSQVNLIAAIKQIMVNYRATFSKKMLLTMAPETAYVQGGQSAFGSIWGGYLPIIDALRDSLDMLQVQLYNSGSMYGIDGKIYTQGTADFIVAMTEAVIDGFTTAGGTFRGLPENKIAVGLPACTSAAGGGYTDSLTVIRAVQYLLGKGARPGSYVLKKPTGYPALGGMMTWSVNWDALASCGGRYQYANTYETAFGVSLPASAGAISGSAAVCAGQHGVTYSVPTIANATSYEWTLPPGASGASTTNSIVVSFASTSGNISVRGSNTFGYGASSSLPVTVNPLPEVSFKPLIQRTICVSAAPILLTGGSPVGGNYSGKGVQNGQFIPALAGIGEATILYSYTNSNGCTASDSLVLKVVPLPTVTFKKSKTKLCIQSAPIALTGGTPSGGIYSGKGVENGVFNPTIAGLGTHTLTYFYTDSNGCASADSTTLSVVPMPTVTLTIPEKNYCTNTPPAALSGGTPSGGIYSGIGVKNGLFDPSITGEGSFTVRYEYTDGNGCSGSDSVRMNVHSTTTETMNITAVDSFTLNGVTYIKSGVYTQLLRNINGCDSTITLALTIATTGVVEDVTIPTSIISPNPATDELVVNGYSGFVRITSLLGQEVWRGEVENGTRISVRELARGVYYVRFGERVYCVVIAR
ncbi:MAG: glycosyl hydrolase family 18 protein [Candidatus Kapaibacterium sp.]